MEAPAQFGDRGGHPRGHGRELVAVDTRKCNHSAGAKPWNVVIMLRDGAVMGLANTTRMAAKPAVAFGQVLNVQPASPLWQQFLLAAMAPVLTALFGGIFAQLIVARYQSRRRAAEEAEQARLRDHDLKMRLVEEMTVSAGGLYFLLQHYWRCTERQQPPLAATEKDLLRSELDAQYRVTGTAAAGFETRLKLLFHSDNPRKFWHAAHDILTVRYFQLIGLATEGLIAANACDGEPPGVWHSGLTKHQLKTYTARQLFDTYRDRLSEAVREVLNEPIVRTSELTLD
jgi:hypothetical protein